MAGLNIGLSIAAAAVVVVGLAFLWWRRNLGSEIALMASMATTKVGDIAKTAPGTLVEIKGTVRCAEPVTADFSQRRCVYFNSEISREEVYYDTDSENRQRRNTRRTTLHSNRKFAPCQVEDGSGTVVVDLEGAEIEAEMIMSGSGIPGNFTNVISSLAYLGSESIHHSEQVLAADIPVYVLGEVRADGAIAKPAKGSHNKKLVISYRSEEERTKELGSNITFAYWSAIVCFAGAAALLVWAFVRGPA